MAAQQKSSPHTTDLSHPVDKNGWTVIKEGKAEVLFPSLNDVFYNPVQEFNRDISVSVIQQFATNYLNEAQNVKPAVRVSEDAVPPTEVKRGIRILEALSASGLRSIRYAKEIMGVSEIVANDWSFQAVDNIRRNVQHNGVGDIVKPCHGDAAMVMYENRCKSKSSASKGFDVIDIDPYGSPTPFLDAALQSVRDGGLLLVTCTDMAVLCGNSPETCYTKYGSIALKSKFCHEQALRIVLQCLEAHANRYGRYIVPQLSLSIDFYCRVFVRVFTSQARTKLTTSKLGHVYQCTGCKSFSFQPLGKVMRKTPESENVVYKLGTGPPVGRTCEFCAQAHHVGGPLWLGPLHDATFVTDLLSSIEAEAAEQVDDAAVDDDARASGGGGGLGGARGDGGSGREPTTTFATIDRMKGILTVVSEELQDIPLYYTQDHLCSTLRLGSGKLVDFRSALLHGGFRVSLSHCHKLAIKTDAPNQFIWDMMRAWEKTSPANRCKIPDGSPAAAILAGTPRHEDISFLLHPDANPESRERGLKRFQVNPEKNWGPKMRSRANLLREQVEEDGKRARNQGKKKRKKKHDADGHKFKKHNAKDAVIEQEISRL